MKTTIAASSSARLITRSMSNRWYRSTETPIAIGIRPKDTMASDWMTATQPGVESVPQAELNEKTSAEA